MKHVLLGMLFGIIFFGMLATAAGFLGKEKFLQVREANNKKIQSQIGQLQTQIGQLQKQLQEQKQEQEKTQTQIQENNPPVYNKTHYALLEADYMARMAALNLAFGPNVPAAIALLQNADQRIKETNDPNLTKIRQALAENILSLQGVPPVDTAGLLARLSAIQDQIKTLPLFGMEPNIQQAGIQQAAPLQEIPINENDMRWKQALKKTWNALQQIIIIRHRNQPIAPLITPEQEIYLRQNLHLLLQQTQWGVIHSNAAVYQTSLQQAIDWIQQYFANNETTTQATLTILTNLQKADVQPALPDISSTLKALTDALAPEGNRP